MKVPFTNLKALHAPLKREIQRAIGKVIDSGDFAGGPFVERFEEQFANYCGSSHAIGVGSGTDALWLTLTAMGIGPGDEVITVPMSFIATAEAISLTGARPAFVDIDPVTYTMDPSALESAITSRTKALIPVHLFGQVAEMAPLLRVALKYNLKVIEDAAQSHGAEYQNRKAGSIGHAGCFSFYPGKNLGAIGEAGAIVTNDPQLASRLRALRDHGQTRKYHHKIIGWNSRMDGIQAAVLSLKLPNLDRENDRRRAHAAAYDELLGPIKEVSCPRIGNHRTHAYHIYSVRTPERERVLSVLAQNDIGFGIHYPVPIHLQPAYQNLGHRAGDFPISEACSKSFISLPIFAALSPIQIQAVGDALSQAWPATVLS